MMPLRRSLLGFSDGGTTNLASPTGLKRLGLAGGDAGGAGSAGRWLAKAPEDPAPYTHLVVAARILPAAEAGVPPGGKTHLDPGRLNYLWARLKPGRWTRRQDAASHGRRDVRRRQGYGGQARRYKKAGPSPQQQSKPINAFKVQGGPAHSGTPRARRFFCIERSGRGLRGGGTAVMVRACPTQPPGPFRPRCGC